MIVSRTAQLKFGCVLAAVLVCAIAAAQAPVAAGQALATCGFPFHGQVYNGPHSGLVFSSTLQLAIDASGSTDAVLQTDDGDSIGAVGQVNGPTLTILFNLSNGTHISAVGTADSDIRTCHFVTIFGPLVGPDLDDSGSWGPEPPCLPYPGCRPTATVLMFARVPASLTSGQAPFWPPANKHSSDAVPL
jgi:hypothetical protein